MNCTGDNIPHVIRPLWNTRLHDSSDVHSEELDKFFNSVIKASQKYKQTIEYYMVRRYNVQYFWNETHSKVFDEINYYLTRLKLPHKYDYSHISSDINLQPDGHYYKTILFFI